MGSANLIERADANVAFDELGSRLRFLGFAENVRGSHHIVRHALVSDLLNSPVVVLVSNLQPPLMRDTRLAAESIRLTAIRRMAPEARVRQALELSEWARSLALAGLRERHPAHSERELVELWLDTRMDRPASPRRRR